MDWKELAVNVLLPLVKTVGKTGFTGILEDLYTNDPKACEVVLVSVHKPLTTYLVPLVGSSKTKVDDVVVDIVVSSIEEVAANHNIELPS
jgi:hypothetical protein